MTENEAIEILKNNFPKTCKIVDGRYKGGFDDTECDFGKALLLSISALEELEQYRTIGTIEKVSKLQEDNKTLSRMYEKLNDQEVDEYHRLKEYEEVGTVIECQEAMEKQKPKSPNIWGDGSADGKPVYDMYDCPSCNKSYEMEYEEYKYCPECGQAIDWRKVKYG